MVLLGDAGANDLLCDLTVRGTKVAHGVPVLIGVGPQTFTDSPVASRVIVTLGVERTSSISERAQSAVACLSMFTPFRSEVI